jgi:CRP-like cAMP-binding protein
MDIRAFDLPRYLGVLPLFSDLNPPELERLALGCQLRRYTRGETIFRVGAPCEEFHVTVTGQVKLFAVSPGGQEKVIELVGPGNSFAEALMFTGQALHHQRAGLSDTLLLSVQKHAVCARSSATHALPCACWRASRAGCTAWCTTCRPTRCTAACSASSATCCATSADDNVGGERPASHRHRLPVSKATVASRLSLTPEYFSRVLHELEAHGADRRSTSGTSTSWMPSAPR